ncbi:MAG: hypothetical protein M1840_008474 [Geoglossum simile]|nr:MAG: hypothetical protein M1840_008474 [Geoglossum simile]
MADISPVGGISSLSSLGAFSTSLAQSLVEDYARNELPSESTSRILDAFLNHLPLDSSAVVAEDIISKKDSLKELADHYVSSLLIPLRAGSGKTPKAISTRSGMGLEDVDDIAAEITPQRRDQTKVKADCLARDGNCCLITGAYDIKVALRTFSAAERKNITTVATEAAHIMPFSLAAFGEHDRQSKAIIWEGIYHMFPGIQNYSPDDINDPRNVLTLYPMLHAEFGKFTMCLEPTATPNRYHIKKYDNFPSFYEHGLPSDGFVTFTAHDGRYPLPDPKLLSVHAAIGAVLHASGMTENIERILSDFNELRCLAPNGSTEIGMMMLIAF